MAMVMAATVTRLMAAMPIGPIGTAIAPSNRTGIIGTTITTIIGHCFHTDRSGKNGEADQLSATSTITNSASSLAVMVIASSARMASPSRARAFTPFTSAAPRASTR